MQGLWQEVINCQVHSDRVQIMFKDDETGAAQSNRVAET